MDNLLRVLAECDTLEKLAGFIAARTPAVPFTPAERAAVLRREKELRREGR